MKKLILMLSFCTWAIIPSDEFIEQDIRTKLRTANIDDDVLESIDSLFISAEEDLIMPRSNIQPSAAQEERIVVLLRDIEHLEWKMVILSHELDEARMSGTVVQIDETHFHTIGKDAHRCFEQSFKTRNALQNKREQLEKLLTNQ